MVSTRLSLLVMGTRTLVVYSRHTAPTSVLVAPVGVTVTVALARGYSFSSLALRRSTSRHVARFFLPSRVIVAPAGTSKIVVIGSPLRNRLSRLRGPPL